MFSAKLTLSTLTQLIHAFSLVLGRPPSISDSYTDTQYVKANTHE